MRPIDLTGQRYGRLVAISRDSYKNKKTWWKFQCDCGSLFVTTLDRVRSGQTKSCGCQNIDSIRSRSITHGHSVGYSASKTLLAYRAAKGRCTNPANHKYPNYGGRGIKMCDQWLASFQTFLDDMGECPAGMTLDRIDVHGNYEPGNCRWATPKQQARNRTDNHFVVHAGERMILKDYCALMDISYEKSSSLLASGVLLHDLPKRLENTKFVDYYAASCKAE